MKKSPAAFTLIELLVVISIIAVLAGLAFPALSNALTKGQMTGTMNNARQLFLAGFQMSNDGTANSDPNYTWPGGYTETTLDSYLSRLHENGYLQTGDLQKILSAPGITCTVTAQQQQQGGGATGNSVTVNGRPALKVYRIVDTDSANTLFAVSNNFTYNTALPVSGPTSAPYADKGFIVVRKGGDAAVLRKNQATRPSSGQNPENQYQATVGKLTGDADGTLSTEQGRVLTSQ